MDLSVILPSYLEAENLSKILPKLNTNLVQSNIDFEIMVIDTIKPMDETKKICNKNNCLYFNREIGNDYGDSIRTGFSHANGKFIAVMDADGSHNPNDLLRLYKTIIKNNCSLVIGSRYCKGGFTENNFVLRFMSWVLNFTYRILFGLKIKDVSNSFRIYRKSDISKISLECNDFDIVEEILIKLKYSIKNFTAKEVPISFMKRDKGESKRNLVKFVWSYLKTIRRLLAIKRRVKFHK